MFKSAYKRGFTPIKSGFTLIELLVVISIIGILATLVTANLNAARSRGRDAVRKADLKNIQTALRMYYNDNSGYPADGDLVFGQAFSSGSTIYMNSVPNDPLYIDDTSPKYDYVPDSANDTYLLKACLENKSDTKCVTDTSCESDCGYQISP